MTKERILEELDSYGIEEIKDLCRHLKYEFRYHVYISGKKRELIAQLKEISQNRLEDAISFVIPKFWEFPERNWSVQQLVKYLDAWYSIIDIREIARILKYEFNERIKISGEKRDLIRQLRKAKKDSLVTAIDMQFEDFWMEPEGQSFSEAKDGARESVVLRNNDEAINSIEKGIRELLHGGLFLIFGPKYWDEKDVIQQNIKARVERRIKEEREDYPFKKTEEYESGRIKLGFCSFGDYWTIISQDEIWPHFERRFGAKANAESKFNNLRKMRNRIKHVRKDEKIDEIAIKEGEAAIAWFINILGIRSQF